jgi:uncharacterized protein
MKNSKLNITVVPNAQCTKIRSIDEYEIKISINEAPENNKANSELIKYLSKVLKVDKRDISIISGSTSRHKVLIIKGCEEYLSILEKELMKA